MLRISELLRLDSYSAAKNALTKSIFGNRYMSESNVRKAVQRYLCKGTDPFSRGGLEAMNAKSSFRTHLSLILQEARKQKHAVVAEEALLCAMKRYDVLKNFDSSWLRDAFASCSSMEEWVMIERNLREYCLQQPSNPLQHVVLDLLVSEGLPMSGGEVKGSIDGTSTASSVPVPVQGSVDEGVVSVKSESGLNNNLPSSEGLSGVVGLSDITAPVTSHGALRRLHKTRSLAMTPPNQAFCRYFIRQGLVCNESELLLLTSTLRSRPQCISFRVHAQSPLSSILMNIMTYKNEGIRMIPWLPSYFGAFEMVTGGDVPYAQLLSHRRKLKRFSEDQLVSYQSVSSMLTVYFLNPRPGEHILDACASPGSKTALLLDVLSYHLGYHNKNTNNNNAAVGWVRNESKNHDFMEGNTMVMAMDQSSSRATALKERFRQNSVPFLSVCEGDATLLQTPRKFDKILVDAPCSGESRLGRDEGQWRLWHPQRGVEYYEKQVQLLRRAVCSCVQGGRILYSTCTFNPLENEAVVSTILREFPHVVRLIPLPPLPGGKDLQGRPRLSPALSKWFVPSRDGGFYGSHSEAVSRGEKLSPGLFPSVGETQIGEQLSRCARRLWPHLNGGTEGFFYALLEVVGNTTSQIPSFSLPPSTSCTLSSFLGSSGFTPLQTKEHLKRVGQCFLQPESGGAVDPLDYFRRNGFSLFFHKERGVILVSTAVLEHSRSGHLSKVESLDNERRSHRLLSMGITFMDLKGDLTVDGAIVLRHLAPNWIYCFPLPLFLVQFLLARQKLVVEVDQKTGILTSSSIKPEEMSRLYPLNVGFVNHGPHLSHVSSALISSLVAAFSSSAGTTSVSCVVVVDGKALEPSSSSPPPPPSAQWVTTLNQWCLPVNIKLSRPGFKTTAHISLELQLLCSSFHRNVYTSMIGRARALHSSVQLSSAQVVQELSVADGYHPGNHLSSQALYGVTYAASPYTTSTGDKREHSVPPVAQSTTENAEYHF